jgi:hypothetical protein
MASRPPPDAASRHVAGTASATQLRTASIASSIGVPGPIGSLTGP